MFRISIFNDESKIQEEKEWLEENIYEGYFKGQIQLLTICIKLIDRWNRSDEVRDRRYEQLIEQINRITDDLNYLKGRDQK